MKRSPIRRTKPLSRTGRLCPRSEKMAARYVERRALVARVLAARPDCEARIPGVCAGASVDVHEVLARSAGGSILDEENVRALCRACHDWVGAHPREAMVRGLRRSRYAGRNEEVER